MKVTADKWDDLYHQLVGAGFAPDDSLDICRVVARWAADHD